ncbi:MAG TPA: YhjD/YihY/BrkB family envelope integrity protein, partial [Pseudomonadales bacterium]|nr:YhjD/YihY/BrkB family envelope integrity protein [Pseudomonadales bacterium]
MRTEMDFLLLRRIEQRLFAEDDALPGWRRRLLWPTRLLYVMLRDIFYGPLPLHATSLVYTTLLSLVPLMALGVAVIKLFGLPDQLLPLLHGFLQPLGERGETVNRTVIDFIERIDIAPLGSIGLILLVYVAVTLIYKVERSLNLIWRVRRHRTFLQLIGHCLLLVLLGPLLLVVLMGAIAVVM